MAQTVTIDGQVATFNPAPIERAGRVFVPLRGVFERLGASVVYQSGVINATTSNGRNVSLTIGSNQATVNGTPQTLDVAPFIVGASTYVPLRFVSQALGASVNYDNSTSTVAINTNGGGSGPVAGTNVRRLPTGTMISGTLANDLNTATAQVGDQFTVNVTTPYPNDDPSFQNAYIRGHVAAVTRAGQGTQPQLGLTFDRIVFSNGQTAPIVGHVTTADEKRSSAIPQQAIGALAGMLVGNALGKVVLHTSGGGIAGAAGGFLYGNNLKTNFVIPKNSTVTIQLDRPLRQAQQ